MSNKKGFTLIELLVVMGILGILMAVTILVINPTEYLKRSRDTQRINDLNAVSSAIGLAVANGDDLAPQTVCFATVASTPAIVCNSGASTAPTLGDRTTAGTAGWIRGVDLSGSLGVLPYDPKNTADMFYLFTSSATGYELDASMLESAYYTYGGTSVASATDGGNANTGAGCTTTVTGSYVSTCKYEVGSNLNLIP